MWFLDTFVVGSLVAIAHALPYAGVKRGISEIQKSYDFIIAGGGTTGLTVADRLSAAFPKKSVLVVEYGDVQYSPGIFDPPDIIWGGPTSTPLRTWTFQSLPNPDVKNKTGIVFAGRIVGGSSAVNGMFFDRGSRFDYDAWAEAGGFDSSEEQWGWDALFPYFKKSVTFTVPSEETVDNYNYTWELSAYGGSTPIYSTFPPFLWADHHVARSAWKDMGIWERKECAGGDKDGICWVPNSENGMTGRRSHSGVGHYAAVNETRPNYHLLVKHQVTRIVYPKAPSSGPPLVEVRSLATDELFNVTAKAEVILAAGAFHTPTILLRSGIGPAAILKSANTPVVLDLPGVGSNFQDHSGPALSWDYTKPGNWSPMPSDMLNPAFAAEATAQFNSIPAKGPYTLAMSNSAIFTSLPNMTITYSTIISRLRKMAVSGLASSYLPAEYRTNPSMIAGYKQQLLTLANLLSNPAAPSLEVAFATGTALRAIQLHPTSRGTVRLNLTRPYAQPILDYRTASNPIDFDIHIAHVKYLRRMFTTPTLLSYGAVEVQPGPNVTTNEQILESVKDTMTFSFMHPCCTAAMLPKSKGGVVGPDLSVHGAKGLRVVDISILPLLPSSHLSATAYAVGERAADLIIKRWSR